MDYLFWIIFGYMSGSMLFAYWLPKWVYDKDVCELSEDQNPGTFNVFKQCGISMGILVLLLELGKAFLPVHLAARSLDIGCWPFAFVLAAPVLGHAFPLWNHFKGGKSIASSFGALLGLFPVMVPVVLLAACYLLFSLVFVINPHLVRSVVTFAIWSAGCHRLFGVGSIGTGCCIISLIVVVKHIEKYQGEKIKMELPFRKPRLKK